MSQQIATYLKSYVDFSAPNIVLTASQGQTTVANLQDRKNTTAWLTDGSVDSDNTTIVFDMTDPQEITDIFLLQHNFKSYKVEYWDGAAYQALSPAVDETTYTDDDSHYSFTKVVSSKLKLTIRGTQTANSDKTMYQFLISTLLGKFAGWPYITQPTLGKNKRKSAMLSGKAAIARNLGGFSFGMKIPVHSNTADIDLLAALFNSSDGFLVWPCGGDETQFTRAIEPYRLQDIYLMQCDNDFVPELYRGIYKAGLIVDVRLVEVND